MQECFFRILFVFPEVFLAIKKVVLSGYYGFGNFGDEAILSAITRGLNEHTADLEISVLSNSKSVYLSSEFNIKCIPRMSPLAIINAMLSADLVISGGGGLIQDSSGVSTILYYLGIVRLAKFLGKKVMFYAQGVGPINTDKGKKITANIVNKVDLITVRDEESKKMFRDLGIKSPPIIVTADPVISLEGKASENVFSKEGLDGKSSFDFAISVRAWDSSFDFLSEIAKAGDKICEEFNARVILIPFQKSQDLQVCEKLASLMKSKTTIIKGDYTPEEMVGFIGKMDFLLAMRLHALIFASSSLVPMAGIVYDPKVETFSKSIGIPHWNLENINSEDIFNEVKKQQNEKNKVKSKLTEAIKPLREKSLQTAEIASELIKGITPKVLAEKYSK